MAIFPECVTRWIKSPEVAFTHVKADWFEPHLVYFCEYVRLSLLYKHNLFGSFMVHCAVKTQNIN